MSPAERDGLFQILANRPRLTGSYAVISLEVLDLLRLHDEAVCGLAVEAGKGAVEMGNLVAHYQRGTKDRSGRLQRRNAEIVRLRDEKGLTFGQIPRALMRINPKWCGKDGGPLEREAVEKAYRRTKNPRPG
jgi:hypothetical protein